MLDLPNPRDAKDFNARAMLDALDAAPRLSALAKAFRLENEARDAFMELARPVRGWRQDFYNLYANGAYAGAASDAVARAAACCRARCARFGCLRGDDLESLLARCLAHISNDCDRVVALYQDDFAGALSEYFDKGLK